MRKYILLGIFLMLANAVLAEDVRFRSGVVKSGEIIEKNNQGIVLKNNDGEWFIPFHLIDKEQARSLQALPDKSAQSAEQPPVVSAPTRKPPAKPQSLQIVYAVVNEGSWSGMTVFYQDGDRCVDVDEFKKADGKPIKLRHVFQNGQLTSIDLVQNTAIVSKMERDEACHEESAYKKEYTFEGETEQDKKKYRIYKKKLSTFAGEQEFTVVFSDGVLFQEEQDYNFRGVRSKRIKQARSVDRNIPVDQNLFIIPPGISVKTFEEKPPDVSHKLGSWFDQHNKK